MTWAKSASMNPKSFVILILFTIATLIPATAWAQKNKGSSGGSGGGGSAPPHNTTSPPPGNRGGGNTNTGGHPSGGNTGGSSGGVGNKGGSTGTTNNGTFGSHNSSNPYGEYGKSGGSAGTGATTGGSKSNPYGEYGNSSKGGSNPYGSYGNKGGTNTTGGSGGLTGGTKGGATGFTGGTKGGSNAGNLTGSTKGGAGGFTGGTKGGLTGGTKGGATAGSYTGPTKGGLNGGTKGGFTGGKGAANESFAGKGGNTGAGFNGKGGNSFAGKSFGPPPGGKSITRGNGDRVDFNKSGTRTGLVTKGGTAARFDSRGHVSSIQSHGMVINHAGRGRTIISERADHSRVVSYGRGRGYSERGYRRGGYEYRSRTYFYHGRYYARAYRGYYWHGYRYYGYVPGYWYSPGFYGWAYNPWATPIAYGWGWGGAPWYGYYGYYFAPYPVYPSAAFWLTDYLMAQSLQAAYEAGQESARLGGGELVLAADQSVVLSPEVKKQISEEVAAIIAQEKNAAASKGDSGNGDAAPDALDPNHRIFIVSSALSEDTADGTSCSLSPGDVITRVDDKPDSDNKVKVSVTASQKDDCAKGSQVSVSLDDLQEMHNHLREQVDDGLSALSKNQGKGGLPSGPAGNPQANPDGQAQPDPNVGSDLQQQQQSADQTEKDVQQSAGADNGA